MVGVLHDQAALCLPEDLVQAHGGHQPGADDLAQNIAGADTGQLVGIIGSTKAIAKNSKNISNRFSISFSFFAKPSKTFHGCKIYPSTNI